MFHVLLLFSIIIKLIGKEESLLKPNSDIIIPIGIFELQKTSNKKFGALTISEDNLFQWSVKNCIF